MNDGFQVRQMRRVLKSSQTTTLKTILQEVGQQSIELQENTYAYNAMKTLRERHTGDEMTNLNYADDKNLPT